MKVANGSSCSVDQLKITAMTLTSGANSAASHCFVQSSCLPYISFAAIARRMTTHGERELHTRSHANVRERLAIRCVGIYCMCRSQGELGRGCSHILTCSGQPCSNFQVLKRVEGVDCFHHLPFLCVQCSQCSPCAGCLGSETCWMLSKVADSFAMFRIESL